MSYDAYGNQTGQSGTATTSLGYDGQFTDQDTGLIYLRARSYEPATGQFQSVDPLLASTRAPYIYAGDDPVDGSDPSGLSSWNPLSGSFWTQGNFISESSFNPVPYYEQEINDYENGCGYFASVVHGIEGAFAGAALVGGGEGESEIAVTIGSKIARQMEARGWTKEAIQQAIQSGERVPAVNKATGNSATRYINPTTGQSVVIDNATGEVIHVGGPGFKYGPGSGDQP